MWTLRAFMMLVIVALVLSSSAPSLAMSDRSAADDDRDATTGSPLVTLLIDLVEPSDVTVAAGAPVTFSVRVASRGLPVNGLVTWRIDGTTLSCVADVTAGQATCATHAALAPGVYRVTTTVSDSDPSVMYVGAGHAVLSVTVPMSEASVGALRRE